MHYVGSLELVHAHFVAVLKSIILAPLDFLYALDESHERSFGKFIIVLTYDLRSNTWIVSLLF